MGRRRLPNSTKQSALPGWWGLLLITVVLAGCRPAAPSITGAPTDPLPVDVPALPFADNPDPTLCGIPMPDDRPGIAHGAVDGKVIGPIIYLYNSHLRGRVVGQIYPGTTVRILLSQSNPTLDYYFVKTVGVEPPQEGWIPAPFVTPES